MFNPKDFYIFPVIDIDELSYMGEGEGERAKSTPKQRSFIYSLLNKANMSENDLIYELDVRYGISQFSIKDAGNAIDRLKIITGGR